MLSWGAEKCNCTKGFSFLQKRCKGVVASFAKGGAAKVLRRGVASVL